MRLSDDDLDRSQQDWTDDLYPSTAEFSALLRQAREANALRPMLEGALKMIDELVANRQVMPSARTKLDMWTRELRAALGES